MLGIAIALCAVDKTPRTFEELEDAKVNAFHSIERARIECRAHVLGDVSQTKAKYSKWFHYEFSVSTLIDGSRYHSTVKHDNGEGEEFLSDGAHSWMVNFGRLLDFGPIQKDQFDPKAFNATRMDLKWANPNRGLLLFNVVAKFKLKGSPTTETVKGQVLRKVVSNIPGDGTTLTQWFLPDRWILKKAILVGPAGEYTDTFEFPKIDFNPVIRASEFKPRAGLKRVE